MSISERASPRTTEQCLPTEIVSITFPEVTRKAREKIRTIIILVDQRHPVFQEGSKEAYERRVGRLFDNRIQLGTTE